MRIKPSHTGLAAKQLGKSPRDNISKPFGISRPYSDPHSILFLSDNISRRKEKIKRTLTLGLIST
jgi:hypothetical protein